MYILENFDSYVIFIYNKYFAYLNFNYLFPLFIVFFIEQSRNEMMKENMHKVKQQLCEKKSDLIPGFRIAELFEKHATSIGSSIFKSNEPD